MTPGRRRYRPFGRSRWRSHYPCPPLPYNDEHEWQPVHFTSLMEGLKSNISKPYHCQPPHHTSHPSQKIHGQTSYMHQVYKNNSLSLSPRDERGKCTFILSPSHPSGTSSPPMLVRINPILQFQHLPKLCPQAYTSLLYCSSSLLTISQILLPQPKQWRQTDTYRSK